jgi:hypothetical protein
LKRKIMNGEDKRERREGEAYRMKSKKKEL